MATHNRWVIATAGVLMQIAPGRRVCLERVPHPADPDVRLNDSDVTLTFTIASSCSACGVRRRPVDAPRTVGRLRRRATVDCRPDADQRAVPLLVRPSKAADVVPIA